MAEIILDDTWRPTLCTVTMTHDEIVEALQGRWPEHRVGPTLDRIAALMDLLGNPERAQPVIQITGTNGKGSTAIIIDALLRAAGLRTGRFSSPHLQDLTERVAIDGAPIDVATFDDVWSELEPLVAMVDERRIDGIACTFFEVMTGLAYAAFSDAPVDVAVMEVGMGGRWDATSVADAAVAVVAPVDFDHMQYLGSTIAGIAAEKAGIIKPGAVAVVAAQRPEAAEVLAARCLEVGATIRREGDDFGLIDRRLAAGGQVIRVLTGDGPVGDLYLPLHGEHMAHNAALAVAAAEALLGRPMSPDVIQAGFDDVRAPARLELVAADPPVVLDTAHNPHAVRATLQGLDEAFGFAPVVGVLAMMRDKAVADVLALLEPEMAMLVVTQVQGSPRAMPVDELAGMAGEVFGDERVVAAPDAKTAIARARAIAADSGEQAGVVVLGSVYLAGEVRELLAQARRREQELLEDSDNEPGAWDDV